MNSYGVEETAFTEKLLDALPDIVLAWDLSEGRTLYANSAARALLGEGAVGAGRPGRLPLEPWIPEEDRNKLHVLMHQISSAHDGEACEAEFQFCVGPQLIRWLRCRGVILKRDTRGVPTQVLLIAQDVTERRDAELVLADHAQKFHQLTQQLAGRQAELELHNARLSDLAVTDGLTGLLNHAAFQNRLESEFTSARRERQPFCLLLLDVDHFKLLNDAYGHPAGDAALRAVSDCLRKTARETDVIARYGGEEFAVILSATPHEEAQGIAERLRVAVSEIADVVRPLTVSVGLAAFVPGLTDRAALIAAADRALYAAKHGGRNRVVLSEG